MPSLGDECQCTTCRQSRQCDALRQQVACIPSMCAGDFSQPCALHVRQPIEELWRSFNAIDAEAERLRQQVERLEAQAIADVTAREALETQLAAALAKLDRAIVLPDEPEVDIDFEPDDYPLNESEANNGRE